MSLKYSTRSNLILNLSTKFKYLAWFPIGFNSPSLSSQSTIKISKNFLQRARCVPENSPRCHEIFKFSKIEILKFFRTRRCSKDKVARDSTHRLSTDRSSCNFRAQFSNFGHVPDMLASSWIRVRPVTTINGSSRLSESAQPHRPETITKKLPFVHIGSRVRAIISIITAINGEFRLPNRVPHVCLSLGTMTDDLVGRGSIGCFRN